MFLKHKFVTTLLVVSCICAFVCQEATATYCSLDRMKKFAMEACEHLFESPEIRTRRSISYGHSKNLHIKEPSKYSHYLTRSIFPSGGYLKVGHRHSKTFRKLKVSPPYEDHKLLKQMMHDKKMRHKREDKDYNNYSNNISYCCFNKCEEDFFC